MQRKSAIINNLNNQIQKQFIISKSLKNLEKSAQPTSSFPLQSNPYSSTETQLTSKCFQSIQEKHSQPTPRAISREKSVDQIMMEQRKIKKSHKLLNEYLADDFKN